MIVEGRIHGGLAQGIGQALFEGCVYDSAGQLVIGSLQGYCLPRADNYLLTRCFPTPPSASTTR
jgi:carbon-monoxide dehydrogenase large subunit